MSRAVLLGADWGSSNLRLLRIGEAGEALDCRPAPLGISQVTDGDFAGALGSVGGGWLEEGLPLMLCGMVGSRQGWVEAPYAACPADPGALAARLVRLETPFGPADLVPGLSLVRGDGSGDVMRGEETQILGAAADGLVITPGTHSKWARVAGGRVETFTTFLTGELYRLLTEQSLLGRLMAPGAAHDEAAFALGLDRIRAGGALAALLFSVRADGLLERQPPQALAAYLSGLLIGAEVAAGRQGAGAAAGQPATLIASARLQPLYRSALTRFGCPEPRVIDGDAAVARGLWRLWRTKENP